MQVTAAQVIISNTLPNTPSPVCSQLPQLKLIRRNHFHFKQYDCKFLVTRPPSYFRIFPLRFLCMYLPVHARHWQSSQIYEQLSHNTIHISIYSTSVFRLLRRDTYIHNNQGNVYFHPFQQQFAHFRPQEALST